MLLWWTGLLLPIVHISPVIDVYIHVYISLLLWCWGCPCDLLWLVGHWWMPHEQRFSVCLFGVSWSFSFFFHLPWEERAPNSCWYHMKDTSKQSWIQPTFWSRVRTVNVCCYHWDVRAACQAALRLHSIFVVIIIKKLSETINLIWEYWHSSSRMVTAADLKATGPVGNMRINGSGREIFKK